MSRFQTIRVPSAALPTPEIGRGVDILGPAAQIAGAIVAVKQQRLLAENRTTIIEATTKGIEDAETIMTLDGATAAFEAAVAPALDQFNQISDRSVKTQILQEFAQERARTLGRVVRPRATIREGQAGLAAEDNRFETAVEAGGDPEILSADRRAALAGFVPLVLSPQQATARGLASDRRIAREEFNRLIRSDPGAAGAYLDTPFPQRAIAADELDFKRREALRDLARAQTNAYESRLTTHVDRVAAIMAEGAGSQDLRLGLDMAYRELDALPIPQRPSRAEVRLTLLETPMRIAAMRPDEHAFRVLENELGQTAEEQLTQAQLERQLERTLGGERSETEAIRQVLNGLATGTPINDNQANRAIIDQLAGLRAQELSETLQGAALDKRLIDDFAKIGFLPTPIRDRLRAVLLRPTDAELENLAAVIDVATYVKSQFRFTYDNEIPASAGAFLNLVNELRYDGAPLDKIRDRAWKDLNEIDPKGAAAFAGREGELNSRSLSALARLADKECDLGLDIPAIEPGEPISGDASARLRALEATVGRTLPAELVGPFQRMVLNGIFRGQTEEAAVAEAWEAISRSWDVSGVFRGGLMSLAPHRVYGQTDEVIEQDLEHRIWHDMKADVVKWPADVAQDRPPSSEETLTPGVTERTVFSNFKQLRKYARKRLRLSPHQNLVDVAGRPVYAVIWVDDDGIDHPLILSGTTLAYTVAPSRERGLNAQLDLHARTVAPPAGLPNLREILRVQRATGELGMLSR